MNGPVRVAAAVAAAFALAASLVGCAGPSTAPAATTTTSDASPESTLSGELTIYAAASLGTAFDEIAAAFVEENPGVEVNPIVYDGSSTLATQIIEGAKVDVFASADEKNMAKVTDENLATDPQLFTSNTLVVAVPSANPGAVRALADLADSDLKVVLCAPEVPCGSASQKLLDNAGIIVTAASLEQNVTAVLTKVEADEADAGLVYATDVIGHDVESFVPEGAADVVNRYPLAVLDAAPNKAVADAFADFVLSERGQAILADLGFGAP